MEVKLPNLGEGADSGTVITVFVKEGDRIEKDQPLLELENEKAVATIPSTAAGVISRVHVKGGDKISAGQRLVTIADSAAAPAPAPEAPAVQNAAPAAPAPRIAESAPEAAVAEPAEAAARAGEVVASPSLRKMALDLGLDLAVIRGSGSGGRIVMADLRGYILRLISAAKAPKAAAPAATPAAPAAERLDFSKWGGVTKKPMSQLRKVISRRMLENWTTIPHVTQFDDAEITNLLELRKQGAAACEKLGARLTLTPFILKAVVATLKQHPIFNSSLDETAGEIVYKDYFHIGIAVDTEAGLIVPVIRDVDQKGLAQLAKELEELAQKARDRKVSADELKGGTFTVSNQGGIGSAHFTPIVNKPEVAILGLGRGALQPVVRAGKIEARTMLPLGLSYDHRVIDGGSAARFMVDLVKAIETFPATGVA